MNPPSDLPPQSQSQSSFAPPENFAPDPEERSWCVGAHLSGLVSVFGPLIVWLLRKPQWQALDFAAKEAMNFQLSLFIVGIALAVGGIFTCGLTLIPLSFLGVAMVVFAIVASVKTSRGERYRYPFTIRLIK